MLKDKNVKKNINKEEEYCVSIDWLQFTFHKLTVEQVLSILHKIGLGAPSAWAYVNKGMYGYKDRYLFDSAVVLCSLDGSRTDIHVSLPGSIVHKVDLMVLWEYSAHFTVSRIDFAYDVFHFDSEGFCPRYFYDKFKSGDVVTLLSPGSARILESSNGGCTVYFGSSQSDRMLRIYDKGIESGEFSEQNCWIRFEYQIRHEQAQSLVGGSFVPSEHDIALAIKFLMEHFIKFVEERTEQDGYNACRVCKMDYFWNFFLEKLSEKHTFNRQLLFGSLPSTGHFLKRKLEWLYNQCSGSVSFVCELFGSFDNFLRNFGSSHFRSLNGFLRLHPEFANVELVGGNFMIGDFELDYSSQAAVVFDQ